MTVIGVDGCRGGWAVVTIEADPPNVTWNWLELSEIGAVLRGAATVAIDIPIGLPEVGHRRPCDVAARRAVPGRSSTVFPAPPRSVLDCASYAEARALLAASGGPSMSAQAWGIVAAVRAVDSAVTADSERVVEAHPELSFAAMAELAGAETPLPPKRDAMGQRQRRELLASSYPDGLAALDASTIPLVDGLDALACAWTAGRWLAGRALVVGDGERDARGLPMRIVT